MQDEELEYKRFAFYCIDKNIPVKFHTGAYRVTGIAYRKNRFTNKTTLAAELTALNGSNSLLTVGLKELYKGNHKNEM